MSTSLSPDVKVYHTLEVEVRVTDRPPVSVQQRRAVVQFAPQILRISVHLEGGRWETAWGVKVRGPHITKSGQLGFFCHEIHYGSIRAPLPEWVRDRLLAYDIPSEVREVVQGLAWTPDPNKSS